MRAASPRVKCWPFSRSVTVIGWQRALTRLSRKESVSGVKCSSSCPRAWASSIMAKVESPRGLMVATWSIWTATLSDMGILRKRKRH
ncbi:hypothetical protein D9M68_909930 [compost metagenome]